MPQLTIPEEYIAGLAQIITLPDPAISELSLALSESPTSSNITDPSAVTSLISAKVSAIPTKELRRIMAALLSLYAVRGSAEIPADQFLDDIVRAMKRSGRTELALSDSSIEKNFRNRLQTLLALRILTTASKAMLLQREHEHALCVARIFTDARPVYGEDVASPPSVAIITHMLKLTYHQGSRLEEIHIAFDKADLLNLKSLIARAESKAIELQKVFELAKIPVIE
jgi:hypothetical protein